MILSRLLTLLKINACELFRTFFMKNFITAIENIRF